MTFPDPLADLGLRVTPGGGRLRVWSEHATGMELCLFDEEGHGRVDTVPMARDENAVWAAESADFRAGLAYGVRVSGPPGPSNVFNPQTLLLDPYSRGLVEAAPGQWRSAVVEDGFDWGDAAKPRTGLDRSVIYEAHVKGISRLNPAVPEELRGTYAGLAHDATTGYLRDLGVTAVELLPVHAFASEQRLLREGRINYWGYNTLNFFSPHAAYATRQARAAGPSAVLREFKGMVKLLHEAGLEIILDVVYNHTSEEGLGGPRSSLRGIDNAGYYRLTDTGAYVDTTGCGNTVDFGRPAPQRLVLDSLRYWADEVQVDGFRFDLAATLGRDETGAYNREHPLLAAIADDPILAQAKLIAEPWDVGAGGWQTGTFPDRFAEWNDHYRNAVRTFWLRDVADARTHGAAPIGIGRLATRLAGSSNTFSAERGPLASLNFVSAHDGFTVADLVSYDRKHNEANGEDSRDGTDDNRSFNHGVEGPTADAGILAARRKAMRNLLGTLLLSAGVPMIVAGDEFGRSQNGNNNGYCHDDEQTWLDWSDEGPPDGDWQRDLLATAKHLIALRAGNPALRPTRYGRLGRPTPGASRMDWYDADGSAMDERDWDAPDNRTLQYLAASTPEVEEFNRILLIVHGVESGVEVTLPRQDGVGSYCLLWDSADATPCPPGPPHAPGSTVPVAGTSMQLFLAG